MRLVPRPSHACLASSLASSLTLLPTLPHHLPSSSLSLSLSLALSLSLYLYLSLPSVFGLLHLQLLYLCSQLVVDYWALTGVGISTCALTVAMKRHMTWIQRTRYPPPQHSTSTVGVSSLKSSFQDMSVWR
jgi:uncharacterized membrane protein YGL010W